MIDTRTKFDAALATFSTPGNRWNGTPMLTYWGAACGLDTEAVIGAAHGVGVTSRDADIRRGMVSAMAKVSRFNSGGSVRRYRRAEQRQPQKMPTDHVRRLIEAGQDISTTGALRELSPMKICCDTDPLARRIQSELQLLLLFGRSDIVQIRHNKDDKSADLRTANDWMRSEAFGEIVRPNPFTGIQGNTTDGRPSFISKDCIAAFRHMVFEFDNMTLEDQCRFWAGFIRRGKLPLVSLTYSGGKSLHGVVRVDAPDAETYQNYRKQIIERYACDPEPRYNLDIQALTPLTGCRLAGVVRKDTGKVQELLYAHRNWFDPQWQRELIQRENSSIQRGVSLKMVSDAQ